MLRLLPPPRERLSSHNACVFFHITWGVHIIVYLYTRIYYVRKKTPTSTHTINTPESFTPHTHFGMAVGSMQTWNLSWLFASVVSSIVFHFFYFGRVDQNCLPQQNPAVGYPRPLHILLSLRHWRYSPGSPFALLQSCDNSCHIAKEKAKAKLCVLFRQSKAWYGELFVFVVVFLRPAAAAVVVAAATIVVQMSRGGKHGLCD